jgi:hypothetical protein
LVGWSDCPGDGKGGADREELKKRMREYMERKGADPVERVRQLLEKIEQLEKRIRELEEKQKKSESDEE